MTRPARLVLAAGTATDIGKTWVGGQVLGRLHAAGVAVAARKPAQSAEADDPGPGDAEVLATATGVDPDEVCPPHRSYRVAMAPPMAAEATGLPVPTVAALLDELRWPDEAVDVGWLETVGGPRSPIGADGDAVTLAERLDPDLVVLVADAGLGTINAVALSVAPFAPWPVAVFLNRYDPDDRLHRANLEWLRTREGLEVDVDLEALSERVRGKPLSAG